MKLEKIGAMLTTVVCTCSMLASMLSVPADAAAYDSCDVDRNGVVNILDSIALNRCLMGVDYLSDFNRMDADCNEIINHADAECILSKITGNYYYSIVDGKSNVYTGGAVSSTYLTEPITSMEYVKYNYKTKQTSTYTLDITPATDNDISTFGVIPPDDREYLTNQAEYTGIVRLALGLQNSEGVNAGTMTLATGFIVGDHQIATAAHCVYGNYKVDTDNAYFLTNTISSKNKIYLYDENGNRTSTSFTPVEVHIPKKYIDQPTDYARTDGMDYALITIAEDLNEYTHFTLGLTKDPYAASFKNVNIYVSGMPGSVNNEENIGRKIAKGKGKIYHNSGYDQSIMLCHTADESTGNSGGPIYTITSYRVGNDIYNDYTAIGIVSGGDTVHNYGSRIIPIIQKFYLSNPNASYE